MTTLFISGIDTDVGKTVACGALASSLLNKGLKVFTQKWVETGVAESGAMVSADLAEHEKIAKLKFNTAKYSLHAPYLFKFPASPHLSAKLEKDEVNCDYLVEQTKKLEPQCQHLLIEGAGGLCAPLNDKYLTIDLVEKLELPIVLVSSAKLGSINHTILSLDYCWQRDIDVRAVIYNFFPDNSKEISNDSRSILHRRAKALYPDVEWLDLDIGASQIAMSDAIIQRLLR